jgi:alkyldihydroxyacetonephosphate synthase
MKTYRDILKWGDKREEKIDEATLRVIKEKFNLQAFEKVSFLGNEQVVVEKKCALSENQIKQLQNICGEDNVLTSDWERANHSYGKYYTDLLLLRKNIVQYPPDAVVYPRSGKEVEQIVKLCQEENIALVPVGGQSSVTRGLEAQNGGIALDLTRHLNKILHINKKDHSIIVQSGMYGPELEKQLNAEGYTCGHFPQSFEFSTVGGWVVTKGAGQQSTGYGKIEDMVLGVKMVSPVASFESKTYPRSAQGWDLIHTVMGSEGTLGIVTEVSLKIRKYQPENASYTSLLFKTFEQATEAMRQIMQSQVGTPYLFRISDPAETDIAFKTKNFNGTFSDKAITKLGYKSGERCLMFVNIEGAKQYTKFVKKQVNKIARRHGAFKLGANPTKHWLKQRYSSAYLRDPLMDFGIMTDTLESTVLWSNLHQVWKAAHTFAAQRPKTVLMVHISHVYENGVNLYFTFLSPMDLSNEMEDYKQFHKGLVDAIQQAGGSLSHHHGVGRALAPWMQNQHGSETMQFYKAVKKHFDPTNIINPGNMLGLEEA